MIDEKSGKTEPGILTSVHKTAADLQKAGLVGKAMMRSFDAICLTPGEPQSPKEMWALRERE
jgi:putative transcriptional regulator